MMENDYDLVISGYSSFDHIVELSSPASVGKTSLISNSSCNDIYWGGCSVNIATGLSRLGLKTLPILRVGNDFESSGFKEFLTNEGISLDGTKKINGEINPSSFLLQNPDGEHITAFYAGAMDKKHFNSYEDFCFKNSKAALMTVASKDDNEEFLRLVKKYNLPLFFGMKSDPVGFPKEFLKEIFLESKIIFMNKIESIQIENLLELNDISDLFSKGKTEIIVITLGKEGSVYFTKEGKSKRIQSEKLNSFVDSTGGGDGFITGFLYGYYNHKPIEECCQLGSVVSAYVLENYGCTNNLPTKEKLIGRFNMYKNLKE